MGTNTKPTSGSIEAKKSRPNQKWLMSFFEDTWEWKERYFATAINVYLNDNNEVQYVYKDYAGERLLSRPPKITLEKTEVTESYYLLCSTFENAYDSEGKVLHIDGIEVNEDIAPQAMQNWGMRSSHREDNMFVFSSNESAQNKELLKDVVTWIKSVTGIRARKTVINGPLIIFCVIVLAIIIAVTSCLGDGGNNNHSHKTATCSSCGRTFQAGDSGGNYLSIAKTTMCENCYENFEWANDVLGN